MKRFSITKKPATMLLKDAVQGDVFSWRGMTELAMFTDENTYVWLTGKDTGTVESESDGCTGQSPITLHPNAEVHV